jgi:hypothetical protein
LKEIARSKKLLVAAKALYFLFQTISNLFKNAEANHPGRSLWQYLVFIDPFVHKYTTFTRREQILFMNISGGLK